MRKRTPTPWFQDCVEGETYSHVSSSPGELGDIATAWVNGEANAAFICKAVNAHDGLVEALATIADIAEGSGTLNSFPNIAKIARGALETIKERA